MRPCGVDDEAIVTAARALVAARVAGIDELAFDALLDASPRELVAEIAASRPVVELPSLEPDRQRDLLATAVESLVAALEADAPAPARALEVLPAHERHRLVVEWNATARPFPSETPVHRLVERVCEAHAGSIAVVHGEDAVTFAELNARANVVAHGLVRAGVIPGDRVALVMSRSIALVVAELAVLKCGAAFVPIDEHAPLDRRAFIVEDCEARVVLDAGAIAALLAETPRAGNLDVEVDGAAAAYVMYTSGSTGAPKGCEIAHRSICRLLIDSGYAEFSPRDRVAFVANPAFDASILEVWAPLLHGGRIVVIDHETVLDATRLADELSARAVTILSLTVGLFNRYAAILRGLFSDLDYLFVGGDVVNPTVVAEVLRTCPPKHFIHAYGPTETTLFATTLEVTNIPDGATSLPIGRPIANTTIFILDRHGRPTPVGVVGELHIGGAGVARGYLRRPELNAERFVADPFAGVADARLYRTGDLARYRDDGNIEFVGRKDQQVKIRGYRVELGEIEARLSEIPGVAQAVVLARAGTDDDKRLIAYYTVEPGRGGEDVSAAALRAQLSSWLPAYMVPAAYVALASMPLTPHGKVDRRALPDPDHAERDAGAYVAPRTERERQLAALWCELLGVAQVGRDDNFFALGGHSLLAMTMLDRLHRQGLHAQISAFFAAPTLANLSATVVEHAAADASPSVPALTPDELARVAAQIPGGAANVQDVCPLSPLQEGLLFHHLLSRRGDPYVLCSPVVFDDRARLDGYLAALNALIERHDILRTSIHWEGLHEPVQVVRRRAQLVVEEIAVTGDDALAALRAAYDPGRDRLDLRTAPLLRVLVARDPTSDRWLAMELMHHIASDHTTAGVMRHEIREHLAGRFASLPPAEPLRTFVAKSTGDERAEHEAYFRALLADVDATAVPFGVADVHSDGAGAVEAAVQLDPRLGERLRARARQLGVSPASVVHLAWSVVLARASARDDVVFGTVLLGRMQRRAGVARALGFFINTLPVRARLAGASVETALRAMHDQLAALLRHENASLVLAQRCSGVRSPAPLFTALLNYFHEEVEGAPARDGTGGITFLSEDERSSYPVVLMVGDRGDRFTLRALVVAPLDPAHVCAVMVEALEAVVGALEGAPGRVLVPAGEAAAIAIAHETAQPYEEPIGDVERRVARLWSEALNVQRVGRGDHFFELGGHSLLAIKVVDRMAREGLRAELRALFSDPRLSAFSRSVELV